MDNRSKASDDLHRVIDTFDPPKDSLVRELDKPYALKTRNLARSFLRVLLEYTRDNPAVLPPKPEPICAFLASEQHRNGTYLGHTAIYARGDKACPTEFWRAVAATQDLLVRAADASGGAFVYAPLHTKARKCSYCAAEGIACLRTTRTSRFTAGYTTEATGCQACVYLNRDCAERHVIVIDDSDDEGRPVLAGVKRRRTSAATPTKVSVKTVQQVVKMEVLPSTSVSWNSIATTPTSSNGTSQDTSKKTATTGTGKFTAVDGLVAVYIAAMELLRALPQQDGPRSALHYAIGDLRFVRVPAEDAEKHLRALDGKALDGTARVLRYLVTRIFDAAVAAEKAEAVVEGEVSLGVKILQSRVDEWNAVTST